MYCLGMLGLVLCLNGGGSRLMASETPHLNSPRDSEVVYRFKDLLRFTTRRPPGIHLQQIPLRVGGDAFTLRLAVYSATIQRDEDRRSVKQTGSRHTKCHEVGILPDRRIACFVVEDLDLLGRTSWRLVHVSLESFKPVGSVRVAEEELQSPETLVVRIP